MKGLTLKQLAQWCGGKVAKEHETIVVKGMQHDSRKIKPGDLFVALTGERVDGHAFVEPAGEAGAVGTDYCHLPCGAPAAGPSGLSGTAGGYPGVLPEYGGTAQSVPPVPSVHAIRL